MQKKHIHALLLSLAIVAALVVPSLRPQAAPLATPPPSDDHFGISWVNVVGSNPNPTRMQQALEAGARWDRFPIYWYDVQPQENGAMNWSKYDSWVTAETNAGLQIQGILLGTANWAADGSTKPRGLDQPPANNPWYQYVYQTVSHYKGKIKYWEIWNEPDLLNDQGAGFFWTGSMEDFYLLNKVGYQAAKAADPSVTVLLASLAFPYNNQGWFDRFLTLLAQDPTAPAHNYYFDAMNFHQYGRSSGQYDLTWGYVGKPSWPGFHNMMKAHGFDKPIWVTESGVAVWDESTGKQGPGRATREEQAAYVLQAYAYGAAAGLQKIYFFQLYDDGAGAHAGDGSVAEFYGMFDNSGNARPSYKAYQTAAKYLSNWGYATRFNPFRSNDPTIKGIDVITLYGTKNGKVTIAWKNDGGGASTISIPASSSSAQIVDKLGNARTVTPVNGVYQLTLPQATNNNNFDCFTQLGCQPNDFIMGGDPVLLVEPVNTVPPAGIGPMQPAMNAPFPVGWGPVPGAPGADRIAGYDVQWLEVGEGAWHDWLNNTKQTSAVFGANNSPVAPGQLKTYAFRVRARDAQGNIIADYTPTAQGSTFVDNSVANSSPNPTGPIANPYWNASNIPAPQPTPPTPTPAQQPTPAPSPTPNNTDNIKYGVNPIDPLFQQYYTKYDGWRMLGRTLSDLKVEVGPVQYYEKGRIEDHQGEPGTADNPSWRFMYGLLVDRLHEAKAQLPVGGDTSSVTYATIAQYADPAQRKSPPAGYSGNGTMTMPDGTTFIPFTTNLSGGNGHLVLGGFWNYINRKELFPGGWLHDVGLPITEPLPATVTKNLPGGAVKRTIYIQAFQRAILTYDPANPADWQIERANIGTDYVRAFGIK